MPLYEYECDACGQRFEIIQKFSEMSEQCRKCGKGPVRRLMSAPGIQFKGSGFYITDYPKKGSSGSESSGSSTGKSESKETKSETKSESTSTESPVKPAAPATTKD